MVSTHVKRVLIKRGDKVLDGRKLSILKAIINDYIDTAEPVGSRTIARKHELGLSSATIRNEMADLEEMGYLEQPHASAGRVPSDKGYRIYVDKLLQLPQLNIEEIEAVTRALDVKINELGQLVRQASTILSKVTKYTSVAITPEQDQSILKAVQVVPIETGKALVLVVTNTGVAKNTMIKISDKITPDTVIRVSNIINEKLTGLTVERINLPIIRELEIQLGMSRDMVLPILNGIADCIAKIDKSEVFLDGASNIFNYPEFRDIDKAKEFLDILEEKDVIHNLLKSASLKDSDAGLIIQIGRENVIPEINGCTLLTTTYSVGDKVIGSIGVIGPTRMEYSRVIASMNFIKKRMNEEIYKIIGESLNGS